MRILKRLILPILLLIAYSGISQAPAPAGFPSPYSSNWYRVGFIQGDSGAIDAARDTTVRPRFPGFRIIWLRSGVDTAEWFFSGAKWYRIARGNDATSTIDSTLMASKYDVDTAKLNLRVSINQKIGLTNLSAAGPLQYNNATGAFSCPTCAVGTGGISSLNGLTASTQTFVFDMVGTNFGVTSSGSAHTFHAPLVNGSDTGLVTPALFTTWNGKQNAITTGSTAQYFRGDFSLATFPTNLSTFTNGPGYITGNQPISFTASGDINGTFTNPTNLTPTLTINANAVTYGKFQAASGQGLLGAQSAGNYQLITLGTGLVMSGGVLSATGSGTSTGLDTLWRTTGKDSLQFTINGRYHSILDSAGGAVGSVSNIDATLIISPTTGAVVVSLNTAHGNTWTASAQVFNGGVVIGNTFNFGATNTYALGTSSSVASHVWSRAFNSDATATLASATGSPVNISINSTPGITLLSTGQAQLNNYTTSSSFTGTGLAFLQTDASGNVIQIPIASVQAALSGTGYVKFSGTTPSYLTPTQVTADLNLFSTTLQGLVPLSGGGTTNFLRADGTWAAPPGGGGSDSGIAVLNGILATRTSGPTVFLQVDSAAYATRTRVQKGIDSLGAIKQTALNGTGYVKFAGTTPSFLTPTQTTADLNLFTTTLQGLVPAPGTVTGKVLSDNGTWVVGGGGGGITQIKARNPLFTVGTDSIALDTLRAPEIPYGNIYTRNGTFSANELVAVGNAAFTVNAAGNVVVTSGNSGTNANYIRLQNIVDEVTQLPRFSRTMYFQANGTGTGIAVGTVKTGVRQSVGDVAAWVNLAASPLQFAIGNTSPTILTNSGSYVNGPTWTTGDSIKVVLTFSDSVAVATVQNVTTNSAVTTLTYNFVTSSSPFLPQISYWAWITFGGQQTIYSEADSSTSVKDPNELLAGTSKTAAYYATNFANRLGWQVGQSVPSSVISAGGSNMTNDYSRVFPQNLNQNPIYFLIEEPCNDIRVGYGGSLAQAEKTVDSMITVCKTRGIKFLLYGLPEDSTVTGPAGNAAVGLTVMDLYFRNKYPQNYINTWDSLVVTPGSDNRLKTVYYITDGIHPNGAAQTVIARIISRSLTYYKNRQANILNTDGLIQVSNGGYASLNAKAVAAAIVGGGTVNVLPKYLASGGLTPSGFSDDGSTEFGAGSWYTTPVLKAGPSHAVTASLYTMSFGSSFTNWYTRMPGGGTNDKIWGFNNNGGTFSGAKLTDGGSAAFTWFTVASAGTTLSTISFQGRTLINGATDDASTGLQIAGGGRADKFGVNTAPVTDSWLILAAGTTSVSPIRLTAGPLKTTTFGGTILYGTGADTSLYVGITRNALNVLTRVALMDSFAIKPGRIPFANSSRYYSDTSLLSYAPSTGLAVNNIQLTSISRKLLDTTNYKPTVVDATGHVFETDWATFGSGSQTWQQSLSTGSILTTTNTVTNTGQIFTWNNGGTGTIKHTGMLADTTNDKGLYAYASDSSMRRISFASLVQYLPADTLNADNGVVISGTGLNHTISLIGSKGNRNVYGTDGSGNASWTDPVSFSGSWTVSASTNVSTVSLTQIVCSRNGLMIHVTLSGSVTATLTATASAITVNLPSGLQAAATTSLSGFGEINPTGISIAGAGVSVTSSSTALVQFVSTSTSSVSWVVSFDYYSN